MDYIWIVYGLYDIQTRFKYETDTAQPIWILAWWLLAFNGQAQMLFNPANYVIDFGAIGVVWL